MATCRLAGELFSIAEFRSIACARCLLYIYLMVPPFKERYETLICGDGLLVCDRRSASFPEDCRCDDPRRVFNLPAFGVNRTNFTPLHDLSISPRLPSDFAFITQQCCEAADRCCHNVLTKKHSLSLPETTVSKTAPTPRCPATWDGWQCFPESDPGVSRYKCPNYIYGDRLRNDIDPLNGVSKECTANGSWFAVMIDGQRSEWTDYRFCVTDNASTLKMAAGLMAFSITVVCILPAIAFISTHRVLYSQPVFIIHKHLLASFLIASLMFIFNCVFFVVDGAPGDHLYFSNHFSCRLLFSVQLRYFRLSTFTWMLAEGVYLYRLLSPFEYDHENLRPYKFACWGAPMVLTVIYSILRQTIDNEECWVSPSEVWWLEWGFMMGPCLVLICANLVLLTLIMCVVIKKIRFNPHMEKAQYTKALRAVILLVPVFGLHFLLTIYRIQSSHTHQIINLILDGLQGAAVSFIVCYQNKSFQECISKTLRRRGLVQSSPNKEKTFGQSFHKETDRFLRTDAAETNFSPDHNAADSV
ncbi:hypothetical protein QR680_013226 [Steinernema hermaphroditum]|uniref:G-protein coupled receptors family 2 profile 2 domain-containing protein n=1 Tax=Steinernema hermaphroditum TaxID=289476 RepID=A0AA39M171_9BILA|nr:hypothetical protein QR680_013226 [Steinernema hermaphroditum]